MPATSGSQLKHMLQSLLSVRAKGVHVAAVNAELLLKQEMVLLLRPES